LTAETGEIILRIAEPRHALGDRHQFGRCEYPAEPDSMQWHDIFSDARPLQDLENLLLRHRRFEQATETVQPSDNGTGP